MTTCLPSSLSSFGGMPLNFAQTLQRRRPVVVADTERFAVELANLGVSVRLTLHWQNRDYWVLVRQRRQDRGDVVLKLISGYVPAHELNLPLHTAIQEIAEECLLETPKLAAVPLRLLKTPVASLATDQARIVAALDFLFQGY